jgi:hypothetical protein
VCAMWLKTDGRCRRTGKGTVTGDGTLSSGKTHKSDMKPKIANQIFYLQVLEQCGCVLFPKGRNLDLTRGLLYVVPPVRN